jgi:hypothetical protein
MARHALAGACPRIKHGTRFLSRPVGDDQGLGKEITLGRRGSAFDISTTYWRSPRKRVQIGWREQFVSRDLIPSGGSQNSLRIQADWLVQKDMELSVLAQRKLWVFPFLAAKPQSNNVISLQFTVYPSKLWSRTAFRTSE